MTPTDNARVVHHFLTSKVGEEKDSCEDVIQIGISNEYVRIAVSDGATTSSFSAEWALSLAKWYTTCPDVPSIELLEQSIPVLGEEWLRNVTSRDLPWHALEKVQQGAFASLLGATINSTGWTAMALGDTCLFHVRDKLLMSSFPYKTSDDFAFQPYLACSMQSNAVNALKYGQLGAGKCESGDLIVVATDGFSHWLLRNVEAGRDPWHLFAGSPSDRLSAVVDDERLSRRMRNDDVGCAWCHV